MSEINALREDLEKLSELVIGDEVEDDAFFDQIRKDMASLSNGTGMTNSIVYIGDKDIKTISYDGIVKFKRLIPSMVSVDTATYCLRFPSVFLTEREAIESGLIN